MKIAQRLTMTGLVALALHAQSTELFPGDGYLQCALNNYSGYNECMSNSADYWKGQWPAVCNRYLTNITTQCGKLPGTFSPTYVILGLLYSPPGNASSVGFSTTATSGTTTSIGNSASQVVDISIVAPTGETSTNVPTLTIKGSQPSVKQNMATYQTVLTSTTGDQIKSVSDVIDHSQDVFYIWLNAAFTPGLDSTHKTANLALKNYQGQPPDIIPITVAELKNPKLIPASKMQPQVKTLADGTSVTQPGLSVLSATDLATILSFDSFASGDPSARPSSANRYYDTGLREPLEGPDSAGFDLPARLIMLAQSASTQIGTTESQTYTSGVSLGLPGIGSVGLTVNQTITTTNSATSGTGQQASATLGSTTVGCCNANSGGQGGTCQLDVFEDLLFQTYVFVPEAVNCGGVVPLKLGPPVTIHQPVLSGTLVDADGQALAYRPITVRQTNGKVFQITTDRKGLFSLYEADNGIASVSYGYTVQNVSFAAGTTENVSLLSGETTVKRQ